MSDTSNSVRLAPIILCLVLIGVYPFLSVPLQQLTTPIAPRIGEVPARFVTEGTIWAYGALVLAIALLGEPRTLASIGLRRPTLLMIPLGVATAIVLLALGGAVSFLTYNVLHLAHANRTPEQVEALIRGSLIYGLALAIRGGVIEEIFYRGLAIEQLTVLTRNRALAALIATLAFVFSHALRFDLAQLIPIATLGFALAGLYLWRHNLWINMVAHAFVDGLAFVVVAVHATKLY
jgi:membrane protease YdiL (CAAX protease family)